MGTGRTRRGTTALALVAGLSLLLSACAGDEPDPADDAAGGETADAREDEADGDGDAADLEPVEPFEMAVPGTGTGVFWTLPYYVAQETGIFEDYGANVEVRALGPGVDGARAVQTGEVDFGVWTTPGLTTMAANVDDTLRIIHGFHQDDWLVATADPDVRTCEDLEGQEAIAVDAVGGARWFILQQTLENCGLTIDDVTTVDFGGTVIVESMAAGRITTSILHIDEQVRIDPFLDEPLHVVEWYHDVVDEQHFVVTYAPEALIDEHSEHLTRVLAGVTEAIRFMYDEENWDTVVDIAMEFTTIGDDPAITRDAIEAYVELDFWGLDSDGLDEAGINATVESQI
jgi:NitT/TauT family transport system substrate-binding protein